MKKKVYLDDYRIPVDLEWVLTVNYDDFVTKVTEIGLQNIEVISLDHDLGDSAMKQYYDNVVPNATIDYSQITEKTGYDVAKWLVAQSIQTGIPLPQIYTHSANPVGSANILSLLRNYRKMQGLPHIDTKWVLPFTHRNGNKD